MADSQLTSRLRTAVNETLDEDDAWSLSSVEGESRITLSDRTLTVAEYDAPTETSCWVLTLSVADETVGKFGPYESVDAVVDQLQAVLTSDALYTVCCDGSPE